MITAPATVGSLVDRGSEFVPGTVCYCRADRNFPLGHRVTSLLSNPAGVLVNSMQADRPARSGALFGLRPVIIGMISSRLPNACTAP